MEGRDIWHKAIRLWWVLPLLIFDVLYYYFVQILIEQRGVDDIVFAPEAILFIFVISLFSIGCVFWIKAFIDRFKLDILPLKYLSIIVLSFLVFIFFAAGMQILLEVQSGRTLDWRFIFNNQVIFFFLHLIVGNSAVAVAYFRDSKELGEKLLREEMVRTEKDLQIMRQQLDPHFLFNNLNSLASLINHDKEKAVAYTQKLSSVFRHITVTGSEELVSLEDEMRFLQDYNTLLKLRYGDVYKTMIEIDGPNPAEWLIIPMSMQILMENVVKHNAGSREDPLEVRVSVNEGWLDFENEIRPKIDTVRSTGIGLNNLAKLYSYQVGQDIHIEKADALFRVKLPLVKRVMK